MNLKFLKSPSGFITLLTLALAMTLQTGCMILAVGAASAGTVAYVRGELDSSLGNPYDKVVRASDLAIGQLEFAKVSEKKDALSAEFIARTAQDKKIVIDVTNVSDSLTRVRIRVSFFGDEPMSLTILDRIKANL